MKLSRFQVLNVLCLIVLIITFPLSSWGGVYPVVVADLSLEKVCSIEKPKRVVSLVPYVSEMLIAFGQEPLIAGLTREDLITNSGLRKKCVGSYFSLNMEAVGDCHPDLIIAAPSHRESVRHFSENGYRVMIMETRTLEDAFTQMAMIGRLFDCEAEATAVIERNRNQLALVKARLAGISGSTSKRVVRVMGTRRLNCPGDDSFQNEMIEAAGGIPLKPGKNGFSVPVRLGQWQAFDPQLIYGCDLNEKAVRALVKRKGWKEVTAVRNGAVTMFPCNLTCYASTRIGYFVEWLAAVLYPEVLADPETAVLGNTVLERRPLSLELPYVEQTQVVRHRVADAEYKSVSVRFREPMDVLSTLEGPRYGVRGVGNTFVPMQASLGHMAHGIEYARSAIAGNLGYAKGEFSGLMTGADMDHLSIQKRRYQDLLVVALVTAGVRGNALRASKDSGAYNKLGTINIIVLTNRRLSPGAMAWAVVSITEAKSAALADLDVRSSYTPWKHRATGTGTDTVIVVQGRGPDVLYTGGHTKIGELIAQAVHAGVLEAISKQNGIKPDRDVFQRLAERKMSLDQIAAQYAVHTSVKISAEELERVLMIPDYAAFIEAAMSLSDEYGKGLIKETGFFDTLCTSVTVELSGRKPAKPLDVSRVELPLIMAKAFGAVVTGIFQSKE